MGAKGDKVLERKALTSEITEYRKLEALNYSSISKFDESPVKFFDEFILGNLPDDDGDTASSLLGNIVDDVILTHQGNMEEFEQHFSDRYVMYDGERGSGQSFDLADELLRLTKKCIVDGEVTESFEDRFKEAFETVQRMDKFKGKTVDYALAEFSKPNKSGLAPESYFKTKFEALGKLAVSDGIKAKGLQIASNALVDPFVMDYFDFSEDPTGNIEKLAKFPIEFEYVGREGKIKGKVEVDEIIVDHKNKTIQPIDLKTTYNNTEFVYNNYLKKRNYIQGGWYTIAVLEWARANDMADYIVLPYKFIVLDTSNNNRRPLVYTLNEDHVIQALNGFFHLGREYKGVTNLVDEIIWCNENGIWNCSKQVYENNGHLTLEV